MWLPPGPACPPGGCAPTCKKRHAAQRSHNGLYWRRGGMEEGVLGRAPHGYRRSGVGAPVAAGMHTCACACTLQMCTCKHTHAHTCTHARSKAPHPSAGTLYLPAYPSAVGSIRYLQKEGDGKEPISTASGLLAPAPPHSLAMQGEGSQTHARHPTAERGNGCCAWRGLMRILGDTQEQSRSWSRPMVQGQGGCSHGQGAACRGQAALQEHMPCRKGDTSVGKKLAFLPQTACSDPHHGPRGPPSQGATPIRTGVMAALHVGTWFPARGE